MCDTSHVTGTQAVKRQIYRRVAQLHIECINQGFLRTLGPRFLALMYEAIDEGADSVLLVRRRGDEVVGFVAGANGMDAIYKRMLRHAVRLGVAIVPAVLSMKNMKRMVEIVRYSRAPSRGSALPRAELLSIGVGQSSRRHGHAEALFQELCATFRGNGVRAFKIVVGTSLAPAQRFYERMGATAAGTLSVHDGESSIVYTVDLE
jgi:ribosomal protein S18 acetylase RimI-like enzyme